VQNIQNTPYGNASGITQKYLTYNCYPKVHVMELPIMLVHIQSICTAGKLHIATGYFNISVLTVWIIITNHANKHFNSKTNVITF